MPETLLHRWNNWEGGVGHPIEEGRNGMHTANKILGLRGELRPAPKATDVTVATEPGHHYQYFFEEPVSAGQVPLSDADSSGSDTTATTLTFSLTVGANDNRLLLVGFLADDATPTSITYGGVAMAEVPDNPTQAMADQVLGVYYLVAPATGANNVVITFAVAQAILIGIAASFYKCDQNNPFGTIVRDGEVNHAGPIRSTIASNTSEFCVDFAANISSEAMTVDGGQTQLENVTETDVLAASTETGAASVVMDWTTVGNSTWGAIGIPLKGASPGPSYLYAQRGSKGSTSDTVKVNKLSLAEADFANLETGQHDLDPLSIPGQPVRHRGKWWFPAGDNYEPRELETVGTGAIANDTLDPAAKTTPFTEGADHFTKLGSQVASVLKEGTNTGGVRITAVGVADLGLEATYGSPFPVGDEDERAAGLASLAGLSFVLNVEGLYSFNKNSRAGQVFEDYRAWRHVFDNISIVPWMGGLALSSPTGLVFWEPGKLPVNVGLNRDIGQSVLSPSGPTGLRGGRYHGLAPTPDFLYNIYQPDITSATVNVMASYPREPGNPYDLVHQQLGTTTLQDTDHMLGCFVSVSSKPLSAEYVTPTLWFGRDDDISYIVLGTTASPFRTRAGHGLTPTPWRPRGMLTCLNCYSISLPP
jgi:hypothetical protein